MRIAACTFLLGILWLFQLPEVPPLGCAWGLLPLAALALWWRWARGLFFLAAGFVWALWSVTQVLALQLPATLEGDDLAVEGVVASLPIYPDPQAKNARFEFIISSWQATPRLTAPLRVRLSWYAAPPALQVGDTWRFTVRLKRPHGLLNPGGFDYEAWLFRHGLRATGYVREDGDRLRVANSAAGYWVDKQRQYLRDAISAALPGDPFAGILTALTIGEEHQISAAQWEVFTRTGTGHLVAISGSHITLIAGVLFFLARALWARLGRAPLYWPAPKAAATVALLGAAYYAALAGFSVPTVRALIMVAVVMLAILLQRSQRVSHTLAIALLLVLCYDPFAVLDAGFWLSFGTVAVILFAMGNRLHHSGNVWWRYGRIHAVIALGIVPLTLVLFHTVSVISPFANFIAVPWFTLLIVPFTLLGALFLMLWAPLGEGLLNIASGMTSGVWKLLDAMSALNFAQWAHAAPPVWALVCGVIGVVVVLAPRGWPGRWVGGVWAAPLVLLTPTPPASGEAWVTLLDVGQGLSATVRTREHLLIFDTGLHTSERFDSGHAVIEPFLRAQGVARIDTLLVSHGDADHIGGAPALLKDYPVTTLLTSVPEKFPTAHPTTCVQGQHWQWDGVDFDILNPEADFSGRRNNGSCVLRVDAHGGGTVLLTGDIERGAEKLLLERQLDKLPAEVLIVPHHGSKTSSTEPFIDAVAPRYALFPVGYRNRYGFPKPEITARYAARNITLLDSAQHGAITVRIHPAGVELVETYRQAAHRIWHHD